LTVITWTIEPTGFVLVKVTIRGPCELTSGPVVPAIVVIVTDPSIPSNAPVPLLVATIQFNPMKEGKKGKKRAGGNISCEC